MRIGAAAARFFQDNRARPKIKLLKMTFQNIFKRSLKSALSLSLGFPVETLALILVTTCACYLSLILTNTSHALPNLVFSNGSLSTAITDKVGNTLLLKQVVISLPKPQAQLLPEGILSSRVIDKLALLEEKIFNLHLEGAHGSKLKFSDLCWKQQGACTFFSPLQGIFLKHSGLDPLEATTRALQQSSNPKLLEYAFEGLIQKDLLVTHADSLVITLFLNYTTPVQKQLVAGWEKRLGAMILDDFYSQDLSLYFEKVMPDGSAAYDLLECLFQLKQLLSTSHQPDLILIGVTLLFMQATLWNLTLNMRTLGSKFTLAFAVFMSSSFAFLVSLVLLRLVGITLSTFHLLESIPFIVVAIGFEKPYLLTKSVLETVGTAGTDPLREKIWLGVSSIAPSILFEYFIEFFILLSCGIFGMDGTVGRVCTMAALMVAIDAIFLFTFYLSLLTLKLELRRMYLDDAAKASPATQDSFYAVKPNQLKPAVKESSTSSLTNKIMSRGKFVAILTFLFGHIISASGSFDADDYSQNTAVGSDAFQSPLSSLLLIKEFEKLLVQVGNPYIIHPIWVPPKSYDAAIPLSDSFINPVTVLVFCVFIAFAAVLGVLLVQNWATEKSGLSGSSSEGLVNNIKATVISSPTKTLQTVKAVELSRADSGTAINNDNTELSEKLKSFGCESLTDSEILSLVDGGKIAPYALEKTLGDYTRAVKIRRDLVCKFLSKCSSNREIGSECWAITS